MVPEQRFRTNVKKGKEIGETLKMIGKLRISTINIERRKTIIVVLAVEVTTNKTHINPQQTNPSKMTRKNGLHQLKLLELKKATIFSQNKTI